MTPTTIPAINNNLILFVIRAREWNYELCAELGGWTSTDVLKRAYGAMGETPKLNGLKKAMGEEIDENQREFKW